MTWSLWNVRGADVSVRPLQALPESVADPWTDRAPPGRLGATGARSDDDRLGWVDLPLTAARQLPEYLRLRDELLAEGFERLVVLAMGGSALCPQALVSGLPRGRGLDVQFLDTLAPEAVREAVRADRLGKTIFLVASKSGATVETRILEAVISRKLQVAGVAPGGQFLAISDPGSPLYRWADLADYRARFLGKPNVGGRFSALSAFGLLPAALAGCELDEELAAVRREREALDLNGAAADPAIRLGALLARIRGEGRLRAHLSASSERKGMLPWLEQLFSETTGKGGTGIVPVILPPSGAKSRGDATLCIHLGAVEGDDRERLEAATRGGVPVIHCPAGSGLLPDIYRWQVAIAVAAFRMGVDPYDQPDVEGTKAATRRLAEDPASAPTPSAVSDADLSDFLVQCTEGGLVINAFGHRSPRALAMIEALRRNCAVRHGSPPAVGFGSALLHSLGQIEKGGPPDLSVLMLTWSARVDIPIPPARDLPSAINGFGTGAFARLQAAADYDELRRRGRHVLWLDGAVPGPAGLAEMVVRLISL